MRTEHDSATIADVDIAARLERVESALSRLPDAIVRAMHEQARAGRLTARDRARLDALVPHIAAAVGDRNFTAADLYEHANVDPSLIEPLRAAVGEHDKGAPLRLGRLLTRGHYSNFGNVRIEPLANTREGWLRVLVRG